MKTRRPTGKRTQRDSWRRLSSILLSDALLASIEVDAAGRLSIESVSWEQYWHAANSRGLHHLEAWLEALRGARAGYVQSRFDLHLAVPYCYAYFSLLRRAVESVADGQADLQFLRAVLGFECASVSWEGRTAPLAVLTSTAKNPVYLLSKLRQPKAYEDPKFLPLSTVFDPTTDPGDRTPLFYHYRQLSPGARGEFRLLICPTVETKARPDAFACLQSLGAAFANKRDTRAHQRSVRIAELAVGPVLQRLLAPLDCCSEPEIRIADLGAGSGDLTRGVLQQVVGRFPQVVRGRRFSWTMVDLAFADPKRHAFSRSFSRRLAELRCQRADYASWIQQQSSSAEGKPLAGSMTGIRFESSRGER